MRLLKQGAEAKLFLDKQDEREVVVKHRIKKNYRVPQIDEKIRKSRTSLELNLITSARRAGVSVPTILNVDEREYKITMEYISGKRIKELFYEIDGKKNEKISEDIGKIVGMLHKNGIIHGDLTTSNMIMRGDRIYIIDFGLGFFSKKVEDQGVDLKLFKEALKSTHFSILDTVWKSFLKGYKKEYKDADLVIRKVSEIEGRARYTQGRDKI